MSFAKIARTVAIGLAVVVTTIVVSLKGAQPTRVHYVSNADRIYMSVAGCEKDFGFGRTLEACH
jgi:hypothetical protein